MFDLWFNEGWMIYWNVVEKDFEILEKEWICKMIEKCWEKVISWVKMDKKCYCFFLLLFLGVDFIFFVLMNYLKFYLLFFFLKFGLINLINMKLLIFLISYVLLYKIDLDYWYDFN